MTCDLCDKASGVYDFNRVCCVARYCLTLPTREAAEAAAVKACKTHGHDLEAIRAEAKRIRDDRMARYAAR